MFHIWRLEDATRQRGAVKLQILIVLVLLVALTAVWVHKTRKRHKQEEVARRETVASKATTAVKKIALNPIDSTKALPADTLAYFSSPNLRTMRLELQKSSMNQIYNEPSVKQFLADVTEKIEELKSSSEGKLGIGMDMVQKVLEGQITVAILKPSRPEGNNNIVFMCDLCEDRDRFKDVAETVINRLFPLAPAQQDQPGGEYKEIYRNITVSIRRSVSTNLIYAYLDDTLVVSTQKEVVQGVINNVRGTEDAKPSLADDPTFNAVRERISGGNSKPILFAYVGAACLLDRYVETIGPERVASIKKAGLYSVKALGYGAHFEGEEDSPHRGLKEIFFIYSPEGERTGFAKVLFGWPKGEKKLLKVVPADALYCSVTKMDLAGLWTGLREAVGALDPGADEAMKQFADRLSKESGIDFEKDLLASLGDEITTISLAADRSKNREATTMTILALKDPKKAEESIRKLFLGALSARQPATPAPTEGEEKPEAAPPQQARLEFAPTNYKGKRIHFMTNTGQLQLPINPAYCISDNLMIIANGADAVTVALDSIGGEGPFLVDSPDFKEVTRHLSPENSAISYFDFKTGTRYVHERAKAVGVTNLTEIGLPLDLTKLPDAQIFEKHFFGVATCAVCDSKGMAFESYSPLGSVGTLLGAVTIAGSVLPQINAKEIFIRWRCRQHLAEIGKATQEYANSHQGNLPEPGRQYFDLVEAGFAPKKVFYCPATGGEAATFPDGMGYQFTILSYSLAPLAEDVPINPDTGQLVGMNHRLPIAWDKKGNHPDGRHVLFLDGHVELLTEEAFLKLIENPQQ